MRLIREPSLLHGNGPFDLQVISEQKMKEREKPISGAARANLPVGPGLNSRLGLSGES